MKTIEELVDEALVPVRKFVTRANRSNGSVLWNPRVEEYVKDTADFVTTRLRLDYEMTDEERESTSEADGMCSQVGIDLIDLIRDGDCENVGDALLKSLDGAVKRGVQAPKSVDIVEAVYYHEYKSKKESTECTLFILLAVEW